VRQRRRQNERPCRPPPCRRQPEPATTGARRDAMTETGAATATAAAVAILVAVAVAVAITAAVIGVAMIAAVAVAITAAVIGVVTTLATRDGRARVFRAEGDGALDSRTKTRGMYKGEEAGRSEVGHVPLDVRND
jgi:hypothetical protein